LLFLLIEKVVEEDCKAAKIRISDYRFTKEQIGRDIGWSNRKIGKHLKILKASGYIVDQSLMYQIIKSSQSKKRFTRFVELDKFAFSRAM